MAGFREAPASGNDSGWLVERGLPARVIHFAYLRCLLGPACYFVAVLLSLIDPRISLVIFMLLPLIYILPGLEQYWLKLAGR